jgi:hypothetical protein
MQLLKVKQVRDITRTREVSGRFQYSLDQELIESYQTYHERTDRMMHVVVLWLVSSHEQRG